MVRSLAVLDWHVGANCRLPTATLVVRRGSERVASWLLNVKNVGFADKQLLAAGQIVTAVLSTLGGRIP